MLLSDFLESNSISVADFAELLGVRNRATVYRYINRNRLPAPEMMRKISELTHGQVTANDFYDLPENPTHDAAPNTCEEACK